MRWSRGSTNTDAVDHAPLFSAIPIDATSSRTVIAAINHGDRGEQSRRFKRRELARWLARIPSNRSRTLTAKKLDELLTKAA